MKIQINLSVVKSIPLKTSVKRYILLKYRYLYNHNGANFAVDYIENIRLSLMSYLAQGKYSDNQIKYWLRKYSIHPRVKIIELFQLAQSRPHNAIAFLKFPNTDNSVVKSKQDAYDSLKEELDTAPKPNLDKTNWSYQAIQNVISWLQSRAHDQWVNGKALSVPKSAPLNLFKPYRIDKDNYEVDKVAFYPTPAKIKQSRKLNQSVWDAPKWLSDKADFENGNLNYHTYLLRKKQAHENGNHLPLPTVGAIELVAKNGSTDYRAVANANKFTNYQQADLYMYLTKQIKSLPNDATFNQHKFDSIIQQWVDDESLDPYGVDMHHATNFLPRKIGDELVYAMLSELKLRSELTSNNLDQLIYTVTPEEAVTFRRGDYYEVDPSMSSLVLKPNVLSSLFRERNEFIFTAQSRWALPEGKTTRFTVGQPLGMMNSFRWLSITNNLIAFTASNIAFSRGLISRDDFYNHHQYFILGDDVVFKHTSIAKIYMKLMEDLLVPISYNKCFGNNLVEFAGQVFIRNQHRQRYVTDMHWINWNNLFDYTIATGHILQWKNLPKHIQRRWIKETVIKHNAESMQIPGEVTNPTLYMKELVNDPEIIRYARSTYLKAASYLIDRRNVGYLTKVFMQKLAQAEQDYEEDHIDSDLRYTTDSFLVKTPDGVHTYNTPWSGLADKSLVPERVMRRQLRPQWKNEKFGFTSTDKVTDLVRRALTEILGV